MEDTKLTYEQQEMICVVIGTWYGAWKATLYDTQTHTHRLGHAKEQLKEALCSDDPILYCEQHWPQYLPATHKFKTGKEENI